MSAKLPAIVSRDNDETEGRHGSADSSPALQRGGGDARLGGQHPSAPPPPPEGQQRVPLSGQTAFDRAPPVDGVGSASNQPQQQSRGGIPSLRNLEQSPEQPNIPPNINAPNLTHYEHHVHQYTFHADCTIYQRPGENPEIYTEPGTYVYTRAEPRVLHTNSPPNPGHGAGFYGAGAARAMQEASPRQGSHPMEQMAPRFLPSRQQSSVAQFEQHPFSQQMQLHHMTGQPVRGTFQPGGSSFEGRASSDLYRTEHSAAVGQRRRLEGPVPHAGIGEPAMKRLNRTQSVPVVRAARIPQVSGLDQAGGVEGSRPDERGHGQYVQRFGTTVPEGGAIAKSGSPSDDVGRAQLFPVASIPGVAQGPLQSASPHSYVPPAEVEGNANDWEAVVRMYLTGEGTHDGIPLKDTPRGPTAHRQDGDRKLLEKRRTIGKTYEKLGKDKFEYAIGYKIEKLTGFRKKQKMYHVIARCRIVSQLRKGGIAIPEDAVELEKLITERLALKQESKGAEQSLQQQQQQHHHQLQQQHVYDQHHHQQQLHFQQPQYGYGVGPSGYPSASSQPQLRMQYHQELHPQAQILPSLRPAPLSRQQEFPQREESDGDQGEDDETEQRQPSRSTPTPNSPPD